MHGMTSDTVRRYFGPDAKARHGVVGWVQDHRRWLLVVLLPTLIVAAYYGLIATPQYQSEAHFLVRSTGGGGQGASGFGEALSIVGVTSQGSTDALAVGDYLNSHDAVDTLRSRVDLVDIFRRPGTDLLSRMWPSDPTPETLLRYYHGQVAVTHESETGLMVLKVRTFRPQDSYTVITALLQLGEQRVNQLNGRAYQSSLAAARRNLGEAEQAVTAAQQRLTAYRQGRRNIDPQATGQAQLGLVSGLQAQLSQARARFASIAGALSPTSPQYVAAKRQVDALAAQVAGQEARLTGGQNTIAGTIGGFEELQLRQQFAAKRYDAAAAALEKARDQAQRQQLFIVRTVEPNMPVKSQYPKGLKTVATVFFSLLLIYAIGWLIAAGVREHAA